MRFWLIAIYFLGLLWGPGDLVAMTVQPVVIDMSSAGRGTTAAINVSNPQSTPLPVEIVVHRLALHEDGSQERSAGGDEDFLIFPPQALIPPNSVQVFRIQWLGEPELLESQSFLFSVNQLPIQVDPDVSAIQLLFNFLVIVNVAPPTGSPELILSDGDVATTADGASELRFVVENPTPVHGYLSRSRVDLEVFNQGGSLIWSRTLEPNELRHIIGLGLVQPNRRRQFNLPLDAAIDAGSVAGRINYVGVQ